MSILGNVSTTGRTWTVHSLPRMTNYVCATIRKPEARRYFRTHASASTLHQAAVKASDIVNPLNTAWVLVTAFLVFFMQAGFMMLEGGFARTREVSNIMIECIIDTAMCGLVFL